MMQKRIFYIIINILFIISTASAQKANYIFLFIGDGMGYAQISAAEAYLAAGTGAKSGNISLSFTSFPATGMATTYSSNSYITCSSAAGTALSTGIKTNNGMLGIDPNGHELKSIAYELKKVGYKIGVASNVSLDHATPAAFFASDNSRNNYYAIACQLAPSGFDFFAGSGFLSPRGRSNSEENVYDKIHNAGYAVVRTQEQLNQVKAGQKVVMVQEEGRKADALTQAIDRTGHDGWTLPDMTKAGIDLLYNPKGFFFMVEGGQIDWASHSNDAAAMVHEVIDFSEAIKLAIDFYKKYPDETLIIVTADHETGGLGLGCSGYELYPALLDEQKGKTLSGAEIAELNKRAGFCWTTNSHTGSAVPVFAIGVGSELFGGKMDNTDIPKKIQKLME